MDQVKRIKRKFECNSNKYDMMSKIREYKSINVEFLTDFGEFVDSLI